MMFRKLYWVTEEVDDAGRSKVSGVYTSIPNLIRQGVKAPDGGLRFRLTLTKLDCGDAALGTWISPGFDQIAEDLKGFVATDEINEEQRQSLVRSLDGVFSQTLKV